MDYTVLGILQARILEWVAFPSSRGSSRPRDPAHVSVVPAFQADSLLVSHQGSPICMYVYMYIYTYIYVLSHFSHVWLCAIPWTAAHQAPFSMGILQARILEWVAMSSFRGSSQPMDWTCVSWIAGRFFTVWATREAHFKLLIIGFSFLQIYFHVALMSVKLFSFFLISNSEQILFCF